MAPQERSEWTMPERSPAYVEVVRLLLQLHQLYGEGKRDAPEADAVRNEMNDAWYGMTDEEQELMHLLSADLYTLSEAPPQAHAAAFDARDAYDAALRDKRWPEVLTLLHHEPGLADAPRAALVRAEAWFDLGHPEIAKDFVILARQQLRDVPSAAPPVRRRRATDAELPTFHVGQV